jgi:hypothetical protein
LTAQSLPQAPQLSGSDLGSVHWLLHESSGDGHVHTPLAQLSFVEHTVEHAPQFLRSVLRSTQAPAQFVLPPVHIETQLPAWQA